jgi:hypothetical protein
MILEAINLATHLRTYAVGARFSVKDVEDQFGWRREVFNDPDSVVYRRARPARPRRNQPRRASAVTSRIDPTRIRTRDQMKAVARGL